MVNFGSHPLVSGYDPMTMEPLFYAAYGDSHGISDLNGKLSSVQSSCFPAAGDCDVRRQAFVRPGRSTLADATDRTPVIIIM